MLSRTLILAAVAFALGCFGAIPADAQNLEAGKSPSQIFSSTCSLCHKSPRGLLKSVSPGSLSGFLRQHYTTSTDMAAAMSAYVLSNGAANAALGGGNLTKQGQEAKSGAAASEPGAEPAGRGRKPPAREAARPDADGLQDNTPPGADAHESARTARQKAAAERRAARLAARSKAGKELPPKDEARHEPPKEEPGKDEAARTETPKTDTPKTDIPKTDAPKTESSKTETAKTESPKADVTRPDPVPAVTPAPVTSEKGPDTAAAVVPSKPVVDDPNRPLTIDLGPAPSPPPVAPAAVAASGPAPVPAGKPQPPISR
jgi:hypothetical protein